MKNKVLGLFLVSMLGANILVSCGTETTPTPQPSAVQAPVTVQATPIPTPVPTATPAPAKTATPKKTTTKTTTTKPAATTATTTKPTTTTATPKPAATAAAANDPATVAKKLIDKVKATYDALNNFSATFSMYTKRNEKTNKTAKPITTAETKYIFQKPRTQIINVTKHSFDMVVGAKMVWKGGDTARVKAGGVLGLFPIDIKLTDDKLTTNRSWTMDKLDHVAMLERATSPKAKLSLVGKSTVNGKEAYVIKITGVTDGLDDLVTEENLSIDAKTFNIVADEIYAGTDLVFQLKITTEGTNITIPADATDF